jgi:NADPH2:quinone reductase
VRHEAVGLNFIDSYHRSGLYPLALPSGLGSEAAGVVEAVGEGVSGFKVDDRIGYFSGPLGAYSTHRTIAADKVVKLPDELGFDEAAAILLKGSTVQMLVEQVAKVQAGDAVLVHAAAGGVGSILVPWLKSMGAVVIAHSGDSKKAEAAAALGAEHSLCAPFDELAAKVRSLTSGKGVRVVFDGIGAASWQASLASVGRKGLLISYGNASGPVPPFSALDLLRAGSIFVTRPTLGDYVSTPQEIAAATGRVFEMLRKEAFEVRIGSRFALADAAQAHQALEGRATTGSTILIP